MLTLLGPGGTGKSSLLKRALLRQASASDVLASESARRFVACAAAVRPDFDAISQEG